MTKSNTIFLVSSWILALLAFHRPCVYLYAQVFVNGYTYTNYFYRCFGVGFRKVFMCVMWYVNVSQVHLVSVICNEFVLLIWNGDVMFGFRWYYLGTNICFCCCIFHHILQYPECPTYYNQEFESGNFPQRNTNIHSV